MTVKVKPLNWVGMTGSSAALTYIIRPPGFTRGWRVWCGASGEDFGGKILTSKAANEDMAREFAEAHHAAAIRATIAA